MISVVRKTMALSLALAALLAGPAFALDTGDIVIESVKGDVRVTMNGAARSVRTGGVLELPATIDTGRDGAIDLRQGATTVSVGPGTRLEFPVLEQRGGAIDRIVQPRGNAFYSIGKRAGRRLRVETPYLVGVIKGTQFNVAVQEDATTISLFEGLLEILASDDSSVIDLAAGEIASRKRGGKSISVMKMEGGGTPPPQHSPAGSGSVGSSQAPGAPDADGATHDDSWLARNDDRGVLAAPLNPSAIETVRDAADASVPVDLAAGLNVGSVAGVDLDAGASVGAGAASVGTAVTPDVPAAVVDIAVATNVELGAGAVDVGANAAIDTGVVTADTGTTVALDVGMNSVAANVDLSAGADVGNVAAIDAGAGAAVDLGTNVEVAANVDVGANVAGVAAAVNTGVDVAAGNVDLGVNVAGVDLGVNLDLDLDDDKGADTDNSGKGGGAPSPATTPVVDVGGVLDGILNRHRKK